MSTMLIEDEKFVRIYNSLRLMDSGGSGLASIWNYPEGWTESLYAHFKSFVQDLRTANINAYNERYEENEPARILSFKEGFSYGPIDLIKALRSISYNIDDQDVNGCAVLLEKLINYVMWQYISDTLEYQQSMAW
ncbi:MAG: hypothetical protein A4E63_01551 [Syntrophorhabdus sp. PtaU1.Bin050]|nr:MAG: hypothetical protein A4E63_01551 [Syntrophorhabdus sp. PtaU1.Bin050]